MNLPNVIEMEKAVLGAMILKDGIVIPQVCSILKEDDFYRPEHRVFFRTIVGLYNKGVTPNLLTLVEELRRTQELERIGPAYVMALGDFNFTTAFAERHSKVIKEKALLRKLMLAGEQLTESASLDLKTLPDIMREAEEALTSIRRETEEKGGSKFSGYFTQKFRKSVQEMKSYAQRKTGYENIDLEQIFTPGLYVLGGLPALGKTTFAWQMLEQLAKSGEKCVYCSYEMSEFELFTKSVTREVFKRDRNTGLTSAGIRRGDGSRTLNEILCEFEDSDIDLNVLEVQEQDIDELLFKLRKYCLEKAPIIVLDYLQIVPIKSVEATAKQAVDEIVRKLKNFQRETGTTFIVISSFNRTNYSQQVAFESFKESGNIEYSADVVWGLQLYFDEKTARDNRENIEKAKNANPRLVELKCLKNRQGKNYSCYFKYYPAVDTFEVCTAGDMKYKSEEKKLRK